MSARKYGGRQKPTTESEGAAPPRLLLLTAALCGAIVMLIEVLGSRVIGPFFGVSLFVWTALISVTLVALAAGYAVGGWLADRRPTPDGLYAAILAAGALTMLIPAMRGPVLKACVPLGLRSGALASALVLFGPPLFLLGCVSPWVIRLAAHRLERVGRAAGLLSAVSTTGSFLGTLLTGFVLIAHVGVSRTLLLAGLALVLLAGFWFAFARGRWTALLVVLLGLPALRPTEPVSVLQSNGTRATVVHEKESFYGSVKVVEYSYEEKRTREMAIDGLVQGGVDVGSGLPVYAYAYSMELVPSAMRPGGRRALAVGLGAGVVPARLGARGVTVDVVEIDPAVVEIARQYFGFRASGDVFVEDARSHLARSARTYDYVLLDVFNGDTTPAHLLSREALELCRARLAPGGLLVANIIGSVRKDPFMIASVVRTLESLFDTVEVFPLFDTEKPDGLGNLTLVAHQGPPIPLPERLLEGVTVHPLALDEVHRFLGKAFRLPAGTPAVVLTDDYNPIDFFDRWAKEKVRADILKFTEWDVLL